MDLHKSPEKENFLIKISMGFLKLSRATYCRNNSLMGLFFLYIFFMFKHLIRVIVCNSNSYLLHLLKLKSVTFGLA